MSSSTALAPKVTPASDVLPTLRVGLLGCGVVGSAVARILLERGSELSGPAGAELVLEKVAVKHLDKPRAVALPPGVLTDDAASIVSDPSIDLIIEVIGGIEIPRSLILSAIRSGKSVVTANKTLLAEWGEELFAVAQNRGVDLYYEAAACGAVPIIRALQQSLHGDRIERFSGILNGTCNYILTHIEDEGCSFEEALADAQRFGYAESDPSADIDGSDAAAKAALLASLAFRAPYSGADVYRKGLQGLSKDDVDAARRFGFVIRSIAVGERRENWIEVGVQPYLIADSHPLARVRDVENAVIVEAKAAGRLIFQGQGAGGDPTASAVVGDLVEAAHNRIDGISRRASLKEPDPWLAVPRDIGSRSFLRFEFRFETGITPASVTDHAVLQTPLIQILEILAECEVGVHRSEERVVGGRCELSLITEITTETVLRQAMDRLSEVSLRPVTTITVGDLV